MTKEQLKTIIASIEVAYPRTSNLKDRNAVLLWWDMINDLDYNVVQNALKDYIMTEKYAPTIADIRNRCMTTTSIIDDWETSWKKVQRAIRSWGRYREEEALDSLDELTREAVRCFGYQYLCNSETEMADRSQFRDAYNNIANRIKHDKQLAPHILEKNRQLAEQAMPSINQRIEEKKEIILDIEKLTSNEIDDFVRAIRENKGELA